MSANLETKRIPVIKDDSIKNEVLLEDTSLNNEELLVEKYDRLNFKIQMLYTLGYSSLILSMFVILFVGTRYAKEPFWVEYSFLLKSLILIPLFVFGFVIKIFKNLWEKLLLEKVKIEKGIFIKLLNKKFNYNDSSKSKAEDLYIEMKTLTEREFKTSFTITYTVLFIICMSMTLIYLFYLTI